jgi:hypothetical protein
LAAGAAAGNLRTLIKKSPRRDHSVEGRSRALTGGEHSNEFVTSSRNSINDRFS